MSLPAIRGALRNCGRIGWSRPGLTAETGKAFSCTARASQAALALAEDDGPVSYSYGLSPASGSSRSSPLSHLRKSPSSPLSTQASQSSKPSSTATATHPETKPPTSWTQQTKDALDLLRNQSQYYAIVEIKNRPYFVNNNDIIVTMRMNDLRLGDVIALDRVREIGSGDYILKGNPYIDPKYFRIKAVVVEHPVSTEIVSVHKKRRGRDKIVRNNNHHTALRVAGIEINKPVA
ncbi:hypothetical protein SpCBS45565_g02506 [Spizellomyces sp. 'palustris']|nr:hypothetical protein SpCBS45565_g02506 [Spizellomyces sp. 'palustris']